MGPTLPHWHCFIYMLIISLTFVLLQDLVVYRAEGKFEKTEQLLYMIHLLLPILEQINQEKDTEMDIESNIQGEGFFFLLIF